MREEGTADRFRKHSQHRHGGRGDRAPEFTLQGSDGRSYRLSNFVGERGVVLAWFPKAFTPG